MKNTSYTQCILCQGEDLAESVRIFNEEMQKHRKDNTTYERYDDSFLIYVKCTEMIPEDIVEQHELQGERHTCSECKKCERILNRLGKPDKRTTKGVCEGNTVFLNGSVCERYYTEKLGPVYATGKTRESPDKDSRIKIIKIGA